MKNFFKRHRTPITLAITAVFAVILGIIFALAVAEDAKEIFMEESNISYVSSSNSSTEEPTDEPSVPSEPQEEVKAPLVITSPTQKDVTVSQTHFAISGNPQIGALNQMTFRDDSLTLLEEIRSAYTYILSLKSELDDAERQMNESPTEDNIKRYTDLLDPFTREGGFYFEKE